MFFKVKFTNRANRDLASVPETDRKRIKKKIDALAENPRPWGSEEMEGEFKGYRRIRVGDYRVIYLIRNKELVIVVVRIGHRREVYKKR